MAALKILCLHDDDSHAMDLSDSLEALGERLFQKHGIDLVYVNSPLISRHGNDKKTKEDLPNRVWWEENDQENPNEASTGGNSETNRNSHRQFVGLDASLLLIRQVWNSMPFWGVLAIGKGSAVGSFLPLLGLSPTPSFCIFIHGESLLEEEELLVDNLPCLHIVGPDPGPSKQLLRQFGGQVHHQGGKKLTKSLLNIIGKFIISQKKKMRESVDDLSIISLQNQLYLAEQEAVNMVAQRIAADPPKALMAVISPQNVGGWSGKKRRGPKDEGGGAPCPSEFLLKREKRITNPNGPNRQHPEQQPAESKTERGDDKPTDDNEEEEEEEEAKP